MYISPKKGEIYHYYITVKKLHSFEKFHAHILIAGNL